jgi:hypothetical protein
LLSIYTDKLHDRYIGDAQPDDSREAIIHPDKSAENKLLRRLIDNLTEVHAFSVIFPGATSAYDGATHPEAECYDLDSFDMAMGTILHGLRSQAFQHLVDLRLTVPGTHDIGKLAGGMSDDVKLQLKHLWLAVVDKTGPGGCWDYRFELEFSPEEYEDGTLTNVEDSGYAPSNLQAQYPNRDYQSEVWGFIQSCRNLESLAVHCTHYLSLDLLNWEPGPKSKGLHALSLARVYAHTSTLINLLAAPPSEAEPSIARRVEFREVKIYPDGGDWSTVCRWLADSCPKLEFFFPYNIGYFSSHPNFCGNNRPWENTNDIWTTSDEDNKSLVAIMGKLVKKAGGRHNYPADLSGYDYGSLEIEW